MVVTLLNKKKGSRCLKKDGGYSIVNEGQKERKDAQIRKTEYWEIQELEEVDVLFREVSIGTVGGKVSLWRRVVIANYNGPALEFEIVSVLLVANNTIEIRAWVF